MPDTPKLYLRLFHGRTDPKQDMDEAGTEGPALGPLKYVHETYFNILRVEFESQDAAAAFGFDDTHVFLERYDDMIHYDGVYYGDWITEMRVTGDDGRSVEVYRGGFYDEQRRT